MPSRTSHNRCKTRSYALHLRYVTVVRPLAKYLSALHSTVRSSGFAPRTHLASSFTRTARGTLLSSKQACASTQLATDAAERDYLRRSLRSSRYLHFFLYARPLRVSRRPSPAPNPEK
jgi:hypothetical protein